MKRLILTAAAVLGLLSPAWAEAAAGRNPAREMMLAHRQAAAFMLEQSRRRGRVRELERFAERFAGKRAYCTIDAVDRRDRLELQVVHYDALPATCRLSGRGSCMDGDFTLEFEARDLEGYQLELGRAQGDGRGLYHRGAGVTPFPVDCHEALQSLVLQLRTEKSRERVARVIGPATVD